MDLLQLHMPFLGCWFLCHSFSFEIRVTQENMTQINATKYHGANVKTRANSAVLGSVSGT